MVDTSRKDAILQIVAIPAQDRALQPALCVQSEQGLLRRPREEKVKYVDDQSFSGYIASGEELTDGIADYSDIFPVTEDLPITEPRVQKKWLRHGPRPWPTTAALRG